MAMLLLVMGAVSATEVDVDMDVENGDVVVAVENNDAAIGFHGQGEFEGNLHSWETGNYLDTNVYVESETGGRLDFNGYQNLANNKVEFESFAYGEEALMNNRFDNSNYVVQFERVDTSADLLAGAGSHYGIGYGMWITDKTTDVSSAYSTVGLYGDGNGRLDTNQWHSSAIGSYGWGNADAINMPSTPGYYTPTNVVEASGDGLFQQVAHGDNGLEMNGFAFGSGTGTFTANFGGSFGGNFDAHAR